MSITTSTNENKKNDLLQQSVLSNSSKNHVRMSKIVDRVVSREMLDSSAEVIAGGLTKIKPELLASIKSSVMRGLDLGLERGIQHEKRNSYHIAKIN